MRSRQFRANKDAELAGRIADVTGVEFNAASLFVAQFRRDFSNAMSISTAALYELLKFIEGETQ